MTGPVHLNAPGYLPTLYGSGSPGTSLLAGLAGRVRTTPATVIPATPEQVPPCQTARAVDGPASGAASSAITASGERKIDLVA